VYTALVSVSQTLRAHLRARFFADAVLRPLFDPILGGNMIITLNNPEEMTRNNAQGVSLWLYRLVRDEDLLNRPDRRVTTSNFQMPPLPLRLHYLVAAIVDRTAAGSADTEQTILGKVLQALHDHPLFSGADLQGAFTGTNIQFRVRLETMSLEELTRVWEALDRAYQLSASYEISLVDIDSEITEHIPLVIEAVPAPGIVVEHT
jgi:hypothetical protein